MRSATGGSLYARETSVPVERSRAEIEALLTKYGADEFGTYTSAAYALVQFRVKGRGLQFRLPLPDRAEARFWQDKRYPWQRVGAAKAEERWRQEVRSRWRALQLVIKAKLEAVECGITSFEAEFLAHFVTHDGRTVGEVLLPELDARLLLPAVSPAAVEGVS